MESMDASLAPSFLQLPAGFRFHPTDEELIVHYLKRKTSSYPLPISIIAEIDLYKFDPWELPSKAVFGEHEWYFFSPRDRKYPNGARPNRAATSGYWKATGIDKPILTSSGGQQVGVKKALVFYGGKPPRGIKTEWIMQEYRLIDTSSNPSQPNLDNSRKGSLRLDDWVLCRIYKKNHGQRSAEQDRNHRLVEEMIKRQQQQEKIIASPLTSRITTTSCDGTLADYTHQSNGDLFRGVADQIQQSSVTQRSWDEMGYVGSPSSKRFKSDRIADSTGIHENNSFISLMNQIPSQSGTFPFYSFSEGLLGDGVLRLTTPFQSSGATWNS